MSLIKKKIANHSLFQFDYFIWNMKGSVLQKRIVSLIRMISLLDEKNVKTVQNILTKESMAEHNENLS